MARKPRTEETWACVLCNDDETFPARNLFFDHCREKHPEVFKEDGTIAATGRGVAHLDGPDWFGWLSQWTLPDGRVLAECREIQERAKNDPMRFM